MRVFYEKYFEEIGDAQGFYEVVDGKLVFLTGWSCNDALYRAEYMNGLLRHAGVEVKPLPSKHAKRALSLIKECFGVE